MTQDSSCAKESHKDETSDLDLELDSLRRKLESVSTLVVMNQLIIYLDFCNNCQCFLLFTRLTWSLKILKERCRHWKGKLHTKQNLILLSLRYKSCLKTNLCRKILKVRHSIHYLVVEYKKRDAVKGTSSDQFWLTLSVLSSVQYFWWKLNMIMWFTNATVLILTPM